MLLAAAKRASLPRQHWHCAAAWSRTAARSAPRRFSSSAAHTAHASASATAVAPLKQRDPVLGTYLLGMGGLVAGMIVLGGVTRLTRSGLSMVDWKPLGRLPPRNDDEWLAEFEKYKQFPEYQKVNRSMSVDEFKQIWYMEWAHRTYGRVMGVLYAVPLAYFVASGRTAKLGLTGRLVGLLGLGAAQGLVGWWMVRSGLEEEHLLPGRDPRVSPYRLAAHLTMALTLYSGLMWTGWTALNPNKFAHRMPLRAPAMVVAHVVGFTVFSGVLVAGNDAGRAYNDWPFYNEQWLPDNMLKLQPTWRNFTENTGTVQFDHRSLAYTTLASTTALAIVAAKRSHVPPPAKLGIRALAVAAWSQATLGIVTLMTIVPVWLGATHQSVAIVTWSLSLWVNHCLRYVRP